MLDRIAALDPLLRRKGTVSEATARINALLRVPDKAGEKRKSR